MSKSKKSGFGKFVLGALVGAGIGVLFAPKKGSETRAELKVKLNELAEKAKNLKANDVKIYIEDKIDEIKVALDELDKEKANQINKKTDELVKYVVEKGTPVMEKTATAIKEKASLVIKDVLKRLEKEEKTAEIAAGEEDSGD